jgi:hypothetical protein
VDLCLSFSSKDLTLTAYLDSSIVSLGLSISNVKPFLISWGLGLGLAFGFDFGFGLAFGLALAFGFGLGFGFGI